MGFNSSSASRTFFAICLQKVRDGDYSAFSTRGVSLLGKKPPTSLRNNLQCIGKPLTTDGPSKLQELPQKTVITRVLQLLSTGLGILASFTSENSQAAGLPYSVMEPSKQGETKPSLYRFRNRISTHSETKELSPFRA